MCNCLVHCHYKYLHKYSRNLWAATEMCLMVVFLLFQYCFTISYRKDAQQRQYDLKADSDSECTAWIDAIRQARYVSRTVPKTCNWSSFNTHHTWNIRTDVLWRGVGGERIITLYCVVRWKTFCCETIVKKEINIYCHLFNNELLVCV